MTRVSPLEERAAVPNLLRTGKSLWNPDLSGNRNPFYPTANGYFELLKIIDSLLLQNEFRSFPRLKLHLYDIKDQINFLQDEMLMCKKSSRFLRMLTKNSEEVGNRQGDGRIKNQRVFAFEVNRYRILEHDRLLAESRVNIFHHGYGLIALKKRRGIRISTRLRRIAKLCILNATRLVGIELYNDLLISKYMHHNNGKAYGNAYLSAQKVAKANRAVYFMTKDLRNFWDYKGIANRYGGMTTTNGSARKAFVRLHLIIRKSTKDLRALLSDYIKIVLRRWTKTSPDDMASAIPGASFVGKHDRFGEGTHKVGRDLIGVPNFNRPLNRSEPPELSQSDILHQNFSSNLTTGLGIRPTPKLALQHILSPTISALNTPQDLLVGTSDVSTSTQDSVLALKELRSTENAGDGLRALEADVPVEAVEATEGPCQHLSPLGYHIPENKMADAKLASSGTRESFWK